LLFALGLPKGRILLKSFVGGAIFGEVQPGTRDDELWVLLHGWARTMADFSAFANLVAKGTDSPWVVRFDLPGFGTSPAPVLPAGSYEYAEIVGDAIGQAAASMPRPSEVKVVVIGHSFGGRVALSLTSVSQNQFALAAVLLSGVPLLRSPGASRKPKLTFRIARYMFKYRLISQTKMEALRVRYGSRDYALATGIMRNVLVKVVNEDYAELIRNLKVPVSLLWGQDDTVAPVAVAERAANLHPSLISLKTMPGDHFLAVASPQVLMDEVVHLVQRTRD